MYEIIDKHLRSMDPDFEKTSSIKWNFTKFVIDREGNVAARLEPTAGFEKMEASIKKYL